MKTTEIVVLICTLIGALNCFVDLREAAKWALSCTKKRANRVRERVCKGFQSLYQWLTKHLRE